MYFILPGVVPSKLRVVISPSNQNTVGVCNQITLILCPVILPLFALLPVSVNHSTIIMMAYRLHVEKLRLA
jgi:hypothetical protein